jgi:hypothetical protein
MIFRFRIVLDVLEDVFRDIEMRETATLEELHNAIVQAFGFEGEEMASFYMSDEKWSQGEEFVLFDMGERGRTKKMENIVLNEILSEKQTKLIYVYDFLNMWTFYVELADITEAVNGTDYPNLLFSHGNLPESPPNKNFEAEDLGFDDFEGPGFENLDEFDEFDERWN